MIQEGNEHKERNEEVELFLERLDLMEMMERERMEMKMMMGRMMGRMEMKRMKMMMGRMMGRMERVKNNDDKFNLTLKNIKTELQNDNNFDINQVKKYLKEIFTLLQDDYKKYKDDVFSFHKINQLKADFESKEDKFKEFLYSERNICENWKKGENEDLFKKEFLEELELFKQKIAKELKEGGILFELNEDNLGFINRYGDRDRYIKYLLNGLMNKDENGINHLLNGFKKFYIKEEAERFFEKRELADLRQKNQALKNQVASKTEVDLSERFKPISRKARMEDIGYTIGKGVWLAIWLSGAICSLYKFSAPSPQAMEILVWLLIRLPFIIVFWVGLAFISKRQREAHNEYIYFTHLFHLLNGMISTYIRSSDEAVRQEFIRAGMSHLASSPLEGLYGKSDKSLEKALSKINFNINKNL